MNPAYNAGIGLYIGAAHIAAIGSAKVRHMLDGQKETFERLRRFRSALAPEGFDVWFHAASLGEFEQARPIIERLLQKYPDKKILVSFFSPSGYEVRCNYNPKVAVVYLPFDMPHLVKRFLDEASPRMAIFVKYEFWGNYLTELKRRGIPTYIISAIFRPTQRFFKKWGGSFRELLSLYDRLYVQDENSRQLLESAGIHRVTVAGDTRFDSVTAIRAGRRSVPEIESFVENSPFTLVAGSSWERDENVYIPWLKANPDVRAIIAPHEFDSHRLQSLRHHLGKGHTLLLSELKNILSAGNPVPASARYIIIDCFGLLSSLYAYADAAYVGGGFGVGIHNINEAAVYGIPVIFGPNHGKFIEARELLQCGGARCIDSRETLASALDSLSRDTSLRLSAGKAAGEYIAAHVGASDIIMGDLFP